MAKTKKETIETTTENIVKISQTNEDCGDSVVESCTEAVTDANIYMGVIPPFECAPTMDETEFEAMVANEATVVRTVESVVTELREFILKHNAIAEGNGYKAEYINYKSLVDSLLRKLSECEV